MPEPTASPPTDRLALLYHLAQTFNSTLDLDQVLNSVIDEVIVATRAERGFVMLKEAGDKLTFRVARGIDQQTIEDPAFQVSRSIVEKVAADGLPIIAYDALTDTRFSMRQSVMILGLRSVLCVGLVIKNNILGVIYVDNRLQAGIFTDSDQELLSAIASNAAIAIENARLYRLAVEKGAWNGKCKWPARCRPACCLETSLKFLDGKSSPAGSQRVRWPAIITISSQTGRVSLVWSSPMYQIKVCQLPYLWLYRELWYEPAWTRPARLQPESSMPTG